MLSHVLTELRGGRCQGNAVVLHGCEGEQDVAIEVAQHPLRAGLGTIDANDAKMLGSNLLDPRVNDAARLLQDLWATGRSTFTAASNGHSDCLLVREKLGNPILPKGSLKRFYLLRSE